MDESIEQEFAQLVAGLSPEQYERFGPGLREFGLALAELRQVQRVGVFYEQAPEDLKSVQERTHNALRLIEDAL